MRIARRRHDPNSKRRLGTNANLRGNVIAATGRAINPPAGSIAVSAGESRQREIFDSPLAALLAEGTKGDNSARGEFLKIRNDFLLGRHGDPFNDRVNDPRETLEAQKEFQQQQCWSLIYGRGGRRCGLAAVNFFSSAPTGSGPINAGMRKCTVALRRMPE